MSQYDLFIYISRALVDTLYMVSLSSVFTLIFGLPLGVILYLQKENATFYRILSFIVNFVRATPFAIFIILVMPLTRWIVGTSIGTTASIVPLTLGAIPFFARQVQVTLDSIELKKLDLAQVLNASKLQVVKHILVAEPLPTLVRDFTLTVVTLISYSALAGIIGGGGLGKVAIQYGYQRYDLFLLTITLSLLLLLVGVVQYSGETIAHSIERKRGLK